MSKTVIKKKTATKRDRSKVKGTARRKHVSIKAGKGSTVNFVETGKRR